MLSFVVTNVLSSGSYADLLFLAGHPMNKCGAQFEDEHQYLMKATLLLYFWLYITFVIEFTSTLDLI